MVGSLSSTTSLGQLNTINFGNSNSLSSGILRDPSQQQYFSNGQFGNLNYTPGFGTGTSGISPLLLLFSVLPMLLSVMVPLLQSMFSSGSGQNQSNCNTCGQNNKSNNSSNNINCQNNSTNNINFLN